MGFGRQADTWSPGPRPPFQSGRQEKYRTDPIPQAARVLHDRSRMKRYVCVAAAVLCFASLVSAPEAWAQGATQSAPQKLAFPGDFALLTVAIKPDQTASFEQVMARVREALAKSGDPIRQRQGTGWRVMRIDKPLPDGNVAYVHVINPVEPDADYTVMQILYDAFPDERQALYEAYRGAFAANVSMATGRIAVDLGLPAAPAAAR